MSVRVAQLLLWTLWASWAFAGAAWALPVPVFIVAALGVTATNIAVAIINFTVISILSSALTLALAPKQKSAVAAQQADTTTVSIGEGPAVAVLGRALLGGSLVDAFNWGPTNEWETQVICLADHEIDALEMIYVNDKAYPWLGDGYLAGFREEAGRNCLSVDFRNGVYPAPEPSPTLTGQHDWSLSDRMHGRSYVTVSYFYSREVFPQGRPRFAFQVRGAKLYDPRLDSTVPGGSGPQRYADPSTWTWSDNAKLVTSNYAWGIRTTGYDGQRHLMVGPGRSLAEEPPEDVIAGANLCDEDVPLKAGGTEKRWRLSAVIAADSKWRGVMEDLAASCAGDLLSRRGVLTVEPGAARVALTPFTDDALILGETVRFAAFQPRDRTVNTVVARYVEPAQLWKQASAPVRRSLDDIAADGEVRELTLDLKHCPSGTQAQRVAEIARRRARLERTGTVTLGPRFMGLEAGDWLPWQSARRFAGDTVGFQVTSAGDGEQAGGANGQITVTLTETAASCWAWNHLLDELDPTANATLPALARDPLSVAGFTVAASVEATPAGASVPVIAVAWTPVTDPSCTEIRAELRRTGTTAVETRVFAVPGAGTEVLRAGLEHDQSYDVRLVPVVTGARRTAPTAWGTVVTDALVLADVAGFAATAAADGISLSWSTPAQPEVTGYAIRRSANPVVAWNAAEVVSTGLAGTTTFIASDDPAPVTFLIRARDRNGRLSPEGTAARVTTQLAAPGDVTSFEAAPNGEIVRFTWTEVDGANDGYEIRAGFTWETGRLVDRPSGYSTSVLWPIVAEEDSIFWIKARSKARLFSQNARFVVARSGPTQSRNIVFSRDYSATGWGGVRHDFSVEGDLLTLDLIGGVSAPFGDYYTEIPLAASFFARAWINTRAAAIVGDSPVWDSLEAAWDDLGDAAWDLPLGDAGTARLDAYIAPALLALPDSLVDGFRLRASDTGVRATAASLSVGVTRAPCRVADGAQLGPGVALGWTIACPAAFSLLFDAAPTGAQSGVAALVTLATTDGAWLQVTRDATLGRIVLTTSTGQTCFVAAPFVAGDVVSVGVFQSATEARLFVATRRSPTVRQAAVAIPTPIGYDRLFVAGPAAGADLAFDDCDFAWDDARAEDPWDAFSFAVGAVSARAPCVIGDVELHTGAAVAAAFAATFAARGPVGFEPFRAFQPGDYRIQTAGVWLHLAAPDPIGHQLAIPAARVFVDVPDVIDRVNVSVTAGDNTITFNRPFYAAPEVAAEWRGGAVVASARIVDVQPTHAVVRLVAVSDFATPVAGDVSLIAAGF